MKISINWINEFVDLSGIEVSELIKRFNLSTAEIEEVFNMGEKTSGVVLAKIAECEPHPKSQKLSILKLDCGQKDLVQVVCGAKNVRVGLVTALATVGSCVNGLNIGEAELAGVKSYGMCLSEQELGIGSSNAGIMDIDTNLKMGTNIKDVFEIDDIVFEIDNKSLTNRPDLWGHYGIAREFAAIFDRKLKPLDVVDTASYKNLKPVSINVDSKNCFRYSAITVNNVTKKVSPQKIKTRLTYCGLRDINLLADMTNYVMLELGQPMHAFDNQVVKGINVLESSSNVKMLTLDNEEYDVPKNSVLICDEQKQPVAIAGVKGGLKSGITDETNSLLLESATFDAVSIRKTVKAVGLATDSSVRYEKSLDPELTKMGIERVLKILTDIDGGVQVTSSFSDCYNVKYPQIKIEISYDFLNRRSGVALSKEKVNSILTSLGFALSVSGDLVTVSVPSFRATKDVSIKEDLVEEVLRMYGYDNIVPQSMAFNLEPVSQSPEHVAEYKTKRLLAEKYGVSEVHSHIWNYTEFNKNANINQTSFVSLLDTSNSGQSGIRSLLAPTLLKFGHENRNNFADIKICEIGKVASGLKNNLAIEDKKLSIVLLSSTKSEKELYFELKQMLQNITESVLNVEIEYGFNQVEQNYMHPVNSNQILVNNKVIGYMGVVHPKTKDAISAKHNAVCLEVDFKQLCNTPKKQFNKIVVSKYQSVDLDFTFDVEKSVKYLQIENVLKSFKTDLSMQHKLKDIYEPEGSTKFVTIAVTICSTTKTLDGADIENFHASLIKHFASNNINLKK